MDTSSLDKLAYTQDVVIIQFYIPIIVKCTGEAPEHVTVTVQCNGTDSSTTYQIRNMNDITGLISVLLNQKCNISIVFHNEAGSSEPFIVPFDTYPNITITSTTPTTSTTRLLAIIIAGPASPVLLSSEAYECTPKLDSNPSYDVIPTMM
ncbi:PREDICTED: uncharacterized protein LOC109587422 [Amphimedon queenslandica]|uniref:Uncharacterized protein n=1 Tax=Amphimedon queenslandica TaxID=400682 RepID=A0AAN0JQA8_AMPQE|nr:PREDICTED: uncharacterized protein LOC109587422 [Amphimedon queenslandica]|eukprot:XP_019859220.1 PREDICTED: uncharacterized protein LOC109587422 [Amphimedon queenslandica]